MGFDLAHAMSFPRASASTLPVLYAEAARLFGKLPAFATRRKALEWQPVTFDELYAEGCALATALIVLGVEPGEHVGLFADNRYEWILCDYGVQLCGAADVPRGTDINDDEIVYILNHAEVKVCIVADGALAGRIGALAARIPALRHLILISEDGKPEPSQVAKPTRSHLKELLANGVAQRKSGDRRVEQRMAQVRESDTFTLIYTSGTTGTPKGVMLTHANILSQIRNIDIDINCTDRVLSLLPVWHVYERVFEMIAISRGCCTYYTSPKHLAEDLQNVQPTFMGSAPRLWESLHQRILKTVAASHPVRRTLFHTAYFLAHHYKESVFHLRGRKLRLQPGKVLPHCLGYLMHAMRWLLLLPWYGFFNAAVLERLRLSVGGAFKGSVSGGGALPKAVDQFFNYLGIPVLEGYGLTETSPVLAVRTPGNLVIGTVGPLLPQTRIRIVDPETGALLYPNPDLPYDGLGVQGEIQVQGPQVMSGYYRNPEATARAFSGDWFRTGDLGMMTANGCLKIVGRCKDTIVLSSGENVEPLPIENCLQQSPLIEHAVLVGQDQKFIGALVVPATDTTANMSSAEIKAAVTADIRARVSAQTGYKKYELIHAVGILPEPFSVGEELTQLLKPRRDVIVRKYEHLIRELYHGH